MTVEELIEQLKTFDPKQEVEARYRIYRGPLDVYGIPETAQIESVEITGESVHLTLDLVKYVEY